MFWQNPSDPQERYVFTTGYVTDANGKTRFATFRYNPDDNSSPVQVATKRAYYPPDGASTEVNSKAVALAVDAEGNVYVTGESENPTDGTMDVITIKYDKDLDPTLGSNPWAFDPNRPEYPGVRRYKGVKSAGPPVVYAEDVPTDITCVTNAGEAVVVAATTETSTTGQDIIAIAYDIDGNLHPAWPSIGGRGAGVRAYDFGGNDRSCEIGGPIIVEDGDSVALQVTMNGTSQDGASGDDDIVALMFNNTGLHWSDRYDNGCGLDDTCTGLTFPGDQTLSVTANAFYTVGQTYECEEYAHPHDFVAIGYQDLGGSIGGDLLWTGTIDFGEDDYCTDARVVDDGSNFRLCLTGYSKPSPTYTVATALYTHAAGVASVSLDWAVTFNPVSSRQHEGLGVAIRAVPGSTTVEEFITGRSTAATSGNFDALTFKYNIATPAAVSWYTLFSDTGNPGYDAGHAVAVDDPASPGKPLVFITGTSYSSSTGKDFVTVCYKQN